MRLIYPRKQQRGFTLVEMLVVAPIVILAIGAFLSAIIAMTGEVLASRASNMLSYNVQDALNRIEQDVKLSSGFLATNTVIGDNQGYNDDSTAFTNIDGTSLILSVVATNTNPVSADSSYVYLKDKPNACSNPQYNTPLIYNVVYFIKNDTLYRRTLMPLTYADLGTVCTPPWQQPSCSPSFMDSPAGQAGTTFCRTKDVQLVEGVTAANFNIQYYNGESTSSVNQPASSATTVADRTAALKAATTVGVSINAQQTASGRPIERSAIIRVSRLDENASSIATVTTDGSPSAPKVSSRLSDPTNAVFTWPTVSTATGYTFEYQVNGGGWVVGFTNQATQTFTVTTATHKDVVNARVTAINSAGSSGFGAASVTVPLWIPFSLQNGWVNYSGGYADAAYTKTSAGLIVMKGLVRAGSSVIATLPPEYRPAKRLLFSNTSSVPDARTDINIDGRVEFMTGSNGWFSLDSISFMPASTTFTPINSFANGWQNFDPSSTTWPAASYATDGAGRIQLAGLISGGTTTIGTTMFTLPVSIQAPESLHVANNSGGVSGHFRIEHTGSVVAKGFSSSWYSLQYMYYTGTRVSGTNCSTQWCALSLLNGWIYYGATYPQAQYTKSSDGLVMLKGLIKGGSTATATIAVLPAGFCPAERHLLGTTSNGGATRIDVVRLSNGTCDLRPGAGSDVGWLSLDTIRYIAEP